MAAGDKIFLDTDVILDHLADRQPFSEYSHRLFALAEQGELVLYVSALSFSNLYYILRKLKSGPEALALLRRLKTLVQVTAVGAVEVQQALQHDFKDFEDALQCVSAVSAGAPSRVLTRNKPDFPENLIPVQTPEEFFAGRHDRV